MAKKKSLKEIKITEAQDKVFQAESLEKISPATPRLFFLVGSKGEQAQRG